MTVLTALSLSAVTAFPALAASKLSSTDTQFLQQAAQSGASEVNQAELELHSADRDAAAFALRMVTDHTKANAKLARIAKSLGATTVLKRAIAGAPQAGTMSGKEYLSAQVSAHQQAVQIFEQESADGKNAALRAFAKATLPTLQAHLALAERVSGKP